MVMPDRGWVPVLTLMHRHQMIADEDLPGFSVRLREQVVGCMGDMLKECRPAEDVVSVAETKHDRH